MAISVNHKIAQETLEKAWGLTENVNIQPSNEMRSGIEKIMLAQDVTFKYILITGFLAKSVEPKINCRALQTGSALKESYDARSLCHGVIVGFEKRKGNLFGLSNEPFVNKPARHPEHDKNNPQLRNKQLSGILHDILELANSSSKEKVSAGLVHILRVGKKKAATEKIAIIPQRVNLHQIIEFTEKFLVKAEGGARLVAIWASYLQLINEQSKIGVYSPNQADRFAKTTGDVEVFHKGLLISSCECKHRPLNIDDVQHGIRKAIEHGIPEYIFVCASGIANGQENEINKIIKSNSSSLDLSIIDIWKEWSIFVKTLNPKRRAYFGDSVVKVLRDIRKFDSANEAAELWGALVS